MFWGPAGCAREITALLDPSDCQMRVTLTLDLPSSITPLQEGVKGTFSLPLCRPLSTPHTSSSPVHVHVTLHFPLCSWEPDLESEFLEFFSCHRDGTRGGTETEGSTGKKGGVWPEITCSRGCFQNYTSEPDWEMEKLGNQERKWLVHWLKRC